LGTEEITLSNAAMTHFTVGVTIGERQIGDIGRGRGYQQERPRVWQLLVIRRAGKAHWK
jgi:hypothetical protein